MRSLCVGQQHKAQQLKIEVNQNYEFAIVDDGFNWVLFLGKRSFVIVRMANEWRRRCHFTEYSHFVCARSRTNDSENRVESLQHSPDYTQQ